MLLARSGLSKLWKDDPERLWVFLRIALPAIMRLLSSSYVYGRERVPRSGGLVVAANHLGTIDPPLIGICSRRTIYYMTKVELANMPFFGDALRLMGAFGVNRGEGDRDALRVARWLVRHGHAVGMFMEGTRQRFGYPGPAQPGAAMIAVQEGVPVVPCGIDTFRWRMRNRRPCCVVWGEPLDLGHLPRNGRGYKEGAALIEREIFRLWRLAAEAVADEFPEELADGSRRSRPLPFDHTRIVAPPWPQEPWAEGPLGSLFKGRS